ncbi:heavy metal transport/detoxification protein [Thioalkalivibrio denitrificans]|uniref:Heavy metal transport/detoxification protein n=1 Tax=Thioalkalivibrio denitrificans TaxID=108003 RepID=A0A1V3NCL4_9GAMM|nr:heavy metal-associated domain-containing protein [Thioalkalivibrio denitrificans]OOG22764.1 heavy metal transport/detoxification protein [Thioalkalivibrio denitrificans]
MTLTFDVQNIQCGGCAASIRKGLSEDSRVQDVSVDIEQGRVSVEASEDIRAELAARLTQLGFPEKPAA